MIYLGKRHKFFTYPKNQKEYNQCVLLHDAYKMARNALYSSIPPEGTTHIDLFDNYVDICRHAEIPYMQNPNGVIAFDQHSQMKSE